MEAMKDKIAAFHASMDYIANPPRQTMKMHESLTPEVIMAAAARTRFDLDSIGLCVACGHTQGCVEPDARRYECEACGEKAVYGAEELAFRLPL
jgi:hypothetical protein